MRLTKKCVGSILIIIFILVGFSIPYDTISILSSDMVVTQSEYEKLLEDDNMFLKCIGEVSADTSGDKEQHLLKYKLFNMIDILDLKVNVVKDDEYYVGGDLLGFSLQSRGVILVGGNFIITENGIEKPFEDSNLKTGDIILSMNDIPVNSVEDISKVLNSTQGEVLDLVVKRNGEMFNVSIKPALDIQTNTYKLGLWVKEDAMGIGTLTFVNATTGRFGALGHCINEGESSECIEISSGSIYESKVLGVKVGKNGVAGELIGTFNKNEPIGTVDKNSNYGVYGYMDNVDEYVQGLDATTLGGRLSVVPGKASILSCIDGDTVESFDIEIVKANFQTKSTEKSMIIRVTDKELIARTGGIVQGMSGSPIIQNGKLVGAVTHVFVNDATKGFGIYIDWMVNQ